MILERVIPIWVSIAPLFYWPCSTHYTQAG
jgi:hypothetical protein